MGIPTKENPENVAKSIFSELDENKDGIVTSTEYKSVASKNPLLLQGIGMFNPEKIQNFPVSAVFPSQGIAITFGHPNWPLVLNIMIGLRLSIDTHVPLSLSLLFFKFIDGYCIFEIGTGKFIQLFITETFCGKADHEIDKVSYFSFIILQ